MRNFAEMNLREATVSITARGRDALSKFPVTCLPTSPRVSDRETAASVPLPPRPISSIGDAGLCLAHQSLASRRGLHLMARRPAR